VNLIQKKKRKLNNKMNKKKSESFSQKKNLKKWKLNQLKKVKLWLNLKRMMTFMIKRKKKRKEIDQNLDRLYLIFLF
jgi:hypothetical protein